MSHPYTPLVGGEREGREQEIKAHVHSFSSGQRSPTTDFLSPTKAHMHGLSLERENCATPHIEST